MLVAHNTFDFSLGCKSGNRVDDDDVDSRRADELVGYFEGLFAVVGLRNPKIVDVYAEFFGIEAVESVLGIDDGCNSALLLSLSDGERSQCGFTRRFRTVDFDDTSARVSAHAQCVVETDDAARNHLDVFDIVVAEFHNRSAAEVFLYLCHSVVERLKLFA